jgi:hypothetical protein
MSTKATFIHADNGDEDFIREQDQVEGETPNSCGDGLIKDVEEEDIQIDENDEDSPVSRMLHCVSEVDVYVSLVSMITAKVNAEADINKLDGPTRARWENATYQAESAGEYISHYLKEQCQSKKNGVDGTFVNMVQSIVWDIASNIEDYKALTADFVSEETDAQLHIIGQESRKDKVADLVRDKDTKKPVLKYKALGSGHNAHTTNCDIAGLRLHFNNSARSTFSAMTIPYGDLLYCLRVLYNQKGIIHSKYKEAAATLITSYYTILYTSVLYCDYCYNSSANEQERTELANLTSIFDTPTSIKTIEVNRESDDEFVDVYSLLLILIERYRPACFTYIERSKPANVRISKFLSNASKSTSFEDVSSTIGNLAGGNLQGLDIASLMQSNGIKSLVKKVVDSGVMSGLEGK